MNRCVINQIRSANDFPFDADDNWWNQSTSRTLKTPPKPRSWQHSAARTVMWDMDDRRGIKQMFVKNGYSLSEKERINVVNEIEELICCTFDYDHAPSFRLDEQQCMLISQSLLNAINDSYVGELNTKEKVCAEAIIAYMKLKFPTGPDELDSIDMDVRKDILDALSNIMLIASVSDLEDHLSVTLRQNHKL